MSELFAHWQRDGGGGGVWVDGGSQVRGRDPFWGGGLGSALDWRMGISWGTCEVREDATLTCEAVATGFNCDLSMMRSAR